MLEPAFPYVFALNGKSSRKRGGEVLAFWEDKIELLHRGEILKNWRYAEMEKLIFSQRKASSGFLSLMLGSMGKQIEDEWLIQTSVETLDFQLEIDSKYRKNELSQLGEFLKAHVSGFQIKTKP